MDTQAYIEDIGRRARRAGRALAQAGTAARNAALRAAAQSIERQLPRLREANARDVAAARAAGRDAAFVDRLTLSDQAVRTMLDGLAQIEALADPVGEITELRFRPTGIQVGKMRVPLGVVGIVFESRPNVTIDAGALCVKSGNATILRGGSEAIHSNRALAACLREGLEAAGLPADAVQLIEHTDRALVGALVSSPRAVDVIIPRGGKSLIERVAAEARVPVIKHLDGICHVYVDDAADLDKAVRIADNAKTHRYGTCNTMETLLVAEAIAQAFLPAVGRVYADKGVELRGDARAREVLGGAGLECRAATEEDWVTEYLAPVLAIRVVAGMDEAIEHINRFGSAHTDAIVTENHTRAMRFLREVDSASVMVNASTRFADGFEYGLGAEIGISNDKFHARGPVGLDGLTTYKWVVLGNGEIRV